MLKLLNIVGAIINIESDEGVLVPEPGSEAHRPPHKEDTRQCRGRRSLQDLTTTAHATAVASVQATTTGTIMSRQATATSRATLITTTSDTTMPTRRAKAVATVAAAVVLTRSGTNT